MTERTKIQLLKYGGAVAVGLLMTVAYLASTQFLEQPLADMLRLLSDGFMLPGFLMVALGCMIWMSNDGMLDGVTFVLSRAVKFLLPFGRGEKDENYGDYVKRQREKNIHGYGFLFVTGGVFLAISLIFLWLFHG